MMEESLEHAINRVFRKGYMHAEQMLESDNGRGIDTSYLADDNNQERFARLMVMGTVDEARKLSVLVPSEGGLLELFLPYVRQHKDNFTFEKYWQVYEAEIKPTILRHQNHNI